MQRLATIAITRYAESDGMISETLAAAAGQAGVSGEILFIEQQIDSELRLEDIETPGWPIRTIRVEARGISHARNIALEEARHDMLLYLDADVVAEPTWASQLCRVLSEPDVVIVASRIFPRWPGRPPLLTRSQAVLDQFSVLDLGPRDVEFKRAVGSGFGVDRSKLDPELRFREFFGRRSGRLFGGEESDFCIRASGPGRRIVYVGGAVVHHVIGPERTRPVWILKRLFYAGHGRAMLGGSPQPTRRPGLADWLLLPIILPPYAAGWIWGQLQNVFERG